MSAPGLEAVRERVARLIHQRAGHVDNHSGAGGCYEAADEILGMLPPDLLRARADLEDLAERANLYQAECDQAGAAERDRLLNTPEFRSFADAVVLEALHQRERWTTEHDTGKTPADWHWLLGWLSSKAVHNPLKGGEDATEKRLHRIITVAAACANWHAQELGQSQMQPSDQRLSERAP